MTVIAAPALPLHTAGKYVAAAYIVFVVVLLVYLGIMTIRTSRTNRQLAQLRQELAERRAPEQLDGDSAPAPHRTAEPEREPAL